MTEPTDIDMLIATCCSFFAVFYLMVQGLRLMFPAWAFRFESASNQIKELRAKCDPEVTGVQIRVKITVEETMNRLVRAKDLDQQEKQYRSSFYKAVILLSLGAVFSCVVNNTQAIHPLAGAYAYTFLLVAMGMVLSALARFRIYRAVLYIATVYAEQQKEREAKEATAAVTETASESATEPPEDTQK